MKRNPLLFTVGPVEMEREILAVGSKSIPYFRTSEFSEMIVSIGSLIKEIVYTSDDSEVLLLTSSGTGAMEAAVQNIFTTEDKLLIVNGGTFGQRFVLLCQTFNIPFTTILLPMGKKLVLDNLLQYKGKGYTGLLVNAHETSTGVLYDLPMIGQFCKQENMLFVVDAISSFLADPYYMDRWFIDVSILSSQKALSIAPGVSILIMNKRTTEIVKRNHVSTVYFDLKLYLKNMENGQTPFTPAVGILLQLHKRLQNIKQKGVEAIIHHTRNLALDFRVKIKDLPFHIPSESLSNALTPLSPLNPIYPFDIVLYLKSKHNVYVNPNGGGLKDVLFRVGHLGNLTLTDNERLITIFYQMERRGLL